MTNTEKTFISNLVSLRRCHHLKQKEMAAILGVKLSRYSAWEGMRNFPPIDYVFIIASYFQYDIREMCSPLNMAA